MDPERDGEIICCIAAALLLFVLVFLLVTFSSSPLIPLEETEYEYVTIDEVFVFIEDEKIVFYFKTDTKREDVSIKAWNDTLDETIDVTKGTRITLKWQLEERTELFFISVRNYNFADYRFGWIDPTF